MSWPALSWAKSMKVGSSTEKAVLLALAYRHNEDLGYCYPSIASICEFTELNRKTVIGVLGKLEAKGFIADTGVRVGRTKSVIAYRLILTAKTEGSQKGDSLEAVPVLRGSSPDFTSKQSQKRDTEREGSRKEDSKESDTHAGFQELDLGLPPLPIADPSPSDVAALVEEEWAKRDFATPIRGGKLDDAKAEKARDLGKAFSVEGKNSLATWSEFFAQVDESDFLQGKAKPSGDRSPFKLSLSWALEKRNFEKVIEGRFNGKSNGTARSGSTSAATGRVLERIRAGGGGSAARGNPRLTHA